MEKKDIIEETKEETNNAVMVKDFGEYNVNRVGRSTQQVFTSIKDQKKIFNLDNNCDFKLNDCKGETLRVKDVLVKIIETPLDEPKVNDETGEIIDSEYKKITILIDEQGKSYVTASKMFTNQIIRYIQMFGLESITKDGLEIKIIERPVKNSSNKALGFELA